MAALRRHPLSRLRRVRFGGLAIVEFTIVLPVLLILLLACGELGRVMLQYNALTKSVRDGGRYLAETARNGAGVIDISAGDQDIAENLIVYGSPVAGDSALLPDLDADDITITEVDSDHISITAAYAYQPLFGVIPTFGLGENDHAPPGTLTVAITVMAL